jgi:deoxyribodipyrimidine photolyase
MDYKEKRNFPADPATSGISVHLAAGTLAPEPPSTQLGNATPVTSSMLAFQVFKPGLVR